MAVGRAHRQLHQLIVRRTLIRRRPEADIGHVAAPRKGRRHCAREVGLQCPAHGVWVEPFRCRFDPVDGDIDGIAGRVDAVTYFDDAPRT